MWQAFFVAIGVSLCLLGGECLIVEKAVLASSATDRPATLNMFGQSMRMNVSNREVSPPEWAPWSLLSSGAVVLLYSITLPRKQG